MKLEKVYNFFFHPEKLDAETKALSVITVIALSIFTAGGFLIAFGIINWHDRKVALQNPKKNKIFPIVKPIIQKTPLTEENLTKIKQVKDKNAEQVALFEKWASDKDWIRFTPQYSHYDWWAFPITRSSAGYGDQYAVNAREIEALKADDEFMHNYRRGVELVVKSWGWDLNKDSPIPEDEKNADQKWTGYGVRLGKMADSLNLFDEKDYYQRLQHFFDSVCVPNIKQYPLEKWIYTVLSRPPPV